jgi:hypothetical protein
MGMRNRTPGHYFTPSDDPIKGAACNAFARMLWAGLQKLTEY